ncbi:MAG: pyruvate kinase [Candidatus Nanoarchaeia archaeon]|nr:pyruvate kinase [Candidatus Nanoarchaeia archaeon]
MKTQIIATLGPSSSSLSMLKAMKKAGMDIARINMKYASAAECSRLLDILKKINCASLVDVLDVSSAEKARHLEFDYIALAFTERAEQVECLRKIVPSAKIIAKIETAKGVRNINEIIKASDGVMVARGDLGDNVPLEKLPFFQKMIIKECNKKGKFVITATEMLLSMQSSKEPTRAEVTDVANAVLDGSSALMLSEETAIGKYPVESVKMMDRIVKEAEKVR